LLSNVTTCLLGLNYGTGKHMADLQPQNIMKAMMVRPCPYDQLFAHADERLPVLVGMLSYLHYYNDTVEVFRWCLP
jgi:hypothetical protein